VYLMAMRLRTAEPIYTAAAKFWTGIFGLNFAIGVASGIVMEFQFGTNWATYSRFVGDVFGSALAAEGIFAFFLESGFLALLLFGWNKVRPGVHFLSTVMVCLGAHFSAVWIIVANSWMQTPDGFHLVGEGLARRAEVTDFWAVVFNPSTLTRLAHTLVAAWQTGAFFVLSVSAYYLLKKRHEDFARVSMKIALVVALVASLGSLVTGHRSGQIVARYQPTKLAAMEGHFEALAPAGMHPFGWVKAEEGRVVGPRIPGLLSWLVYGDCRKPVQGLKAFPQKDWPPVNATFQAFHVMVIIGGALIVLVFAGLFLWRRGKLFTARWFLPFLVASVALPQIANQVGWMAAEVGRQPWIVWGLMRTSDAVSPVVKAGDVLISILLFGVIYVFLFALFIFLLDRKIKQGPVTDGEEGGGHRA